MRALTYLVAVLAALVLLPWDWTVLPGPMVRDETPTEADQPLDTPLYTRDTIYFPSSGVRCQAWLYLPKHTDSIKPPVVVAAHGLGAQKDFGLAPYGERFAAAGLASFIFDYRTFGGSDGEPRHWVSPNRHLADWQSAVDFVTSQLSDKVDTSKLMLWGTSFGAGHALTTAAQLGNNVTAVVAQVPFVDGKEAFARAVREHGYVRLARARAMFAAAAHLDTRCLCRYAAAAAIASRVSGARCLRITSNAAHARCGSCSAQNRRLTQNGCNGHEDAQATARARFSAKRMSVAQD